MDEKEDFELVDLGTVKTDTKEFPGGTIEDNDAVLQFDP